MKIYVGNMSYDTTEEDLQSGLRSVRQGCIRYYYKRQV